MEYTLQFFQSGCGSFINCFFKSTHAIAKNDIEVCVGTRIYGKCILYTYIHSYIYVYVC